MDDSHRQPRRRGITPPVLPETEPLVVPHDSQCLECGGQGCAQLAFFILDGRRFLNWHCRQCRHTWVEPDRRRRDRSDGLARRITDD